MPVDDYKGPVFLTDKARDLNDRFYLILHDLFTSFPNAKLNPTAKPNNTTTNKQAYDATMAQMIELQNEYFLYKNSVVFASEDLLRQVNVVDDQINVLDTQNAALRGRLNDTINSSRSAEGMLDDSQLTRNQLLYGNVALFIFMCAMATGGYVYYKHK